MPRQEEVTAAEELADLKKIIAAERAQRAAELHAKDLQIAALQGETQGLTRAMATVCKVEPPSDSQPASGPGAVP